MVQTFYFLFWARNDKKFMELLQNALSSDKESVLFTDRHKLFFDAGSQTLYITPKPGTNAYVKVVPAKITYRALRKLLNNERDDSIYGEIEYMDDDIGEHSSFDSFSSFRSALEKLKRGDT